MFQLDSLVPVSYQAFLVQVSGLGFLVLKSHQVFQVPMSHQVFPVLVSGLEYLVLKSQ